MVNITKGLLDKLRKNPVKVLEDLDEQDITRIVQKANLAYREGKELILSDDLFDLIIEYIEKHYPENPVLKTIGSAVTSGKKAKLPFYMGSLDKIKTDDKLIERFKANYKCSYVVSEKLDGNSALIVKTDKGALKMYTRGDGVEGQDISHLLNVIQNIPSKPQNWSAVRGELIISRTDFDKVKDQGANARNMVAGLLNAKTPNLQLAKLIQFVAYEMIDPVLSPEKQLKLMSDSGLKVVKHHLLTEHSLSTEKLSEILVHSRKTSEFEVDGIVVMHNDVHQKVSGENPKYAFAFKSVATMDKAEVIVSAIEWNISKDGYMIPVVQFNPVYLAGVTIQKAHGFNGKYIKDNKLGPGSRITIMRSGDVIPYILEVNSPAESGQPQMPLVPYEWTSTGVDIMISDKQSNDDVILKNLQYFFDKIDIKGVSGATIKRLYDHGKKDIKSILTISKKELLMMEGFKDKSADNFLSAIKDAFQNVDCIKVMSASNILGRGMGEKKIKLIVDAVPDIIQSKYIPQLKELIAIKGIEKKTAESFIQNLPKYYDFLKAQGIKCSKPADAPTTKTTKTTTKSGMENEVIVFSGFRDKELEDMISGAGGRVATTVTSKTTRVLVKSTEGTSTKVDKAKELGVNIQLISEFKKTFF